MRPHFYGHSQDNTHWLGISTNHWKQGGACLRQDREPVWMTQAFQPVGFGESKGSLQKREGPPAQYSCFATAWPDCFFKWDPDPFLLTGWVLPVVASNHPYTYSIDRILISPWDMVPSRRGRQPPLSFGQLDCSSLWALKSPDGLVEKGIPHHSTAALSKHVQIASLNRTLIHSFSLGRSSHPGLWPPHL